MGALLLIVGLAVLGFGLWNHLKGKRILAAPFKKTGEIAKNPSSPDPKGAMSTEGKVVPPEQELLSPCTKQPCLAYEVKIERLYEKTETTQDGTKTVKGSETLTTLKGGAVFGLDDGSGIVKIDVSKGADFDNFKDGLKKELNGHSGSSHLNFGELTYDVPVIGGDKGWTTGFKATEKFVPVEGSLFVLGKLEGASLVKPGWRSMMTSAKGREGLLGSIQKKKKFSFIGGGVAAVLSIPAMIFAPEADPNAVSAYCESKLTDARPQCSDTVSSVSGEKYTWTVTKPGEYELSVIAPAKKVSFLPQLILKDAAGEELANELGNVGTKAVTTVDVKAGTYELTVLPGDGYMVKGGFSFDLAIKSLTPDAAPAVAAAEGEEKKGAFTAEELATRVADLNELCPDTFCEGQFNYDFKKLDCLDASHCTLSFVAKDQDHPRAKPMNAEVLVSGFTALNADPEKEFVYEGSFDEKVGEALAKWESNPKTTARPAPVAKAAPAPKPAPAPVKVAVQPRPAPAPKPMIAKPAPKPAAVAVAPVAKPAPVPVVKKSSAPAPVTTSRNNKNLED
ncbi:MAG: GIDE domain-containing protein [Archangium sp.]|nr:GIDE domain-containing protein [Archangium sp.]MDP3575754.1 GIDE domain-containing protein [Archangium sp.]